VFFCNYAHGLKSTENEPDCDNGIQRMPEITRLQQLLIQLLMVVTV